MHFIYFVTFFLMPIVAYGQKPSDEADKLEIARLEAEFYRKMAERRFGRMIDPKIRINKDYNACKKELAAAKKRYNGETLLPDETLESLAAKIEKLEKQKEVYVRIRNRMLAYSIAHESEKEENEDQRGLLAKEAYEISQANTRYTRMKVPIYSALYSAVNRLNEVNFNNPNFNELNSLPEGYPRLGRVRNVVIGKKDKMLYTIASDGLLLKRKLAIYGSKSARKDKINKPQIIASNIRSSRSIDLSFDGSRIASVGDLDSILIHNLLDDEAPVKLKTAHRGKRIWNVKYAPNEAVITTGDNGEGGTSIASTFSDGRSSILIKNTPYRVVRIGLSNEGQYLGMIGKSSKVCIFSMLDQKNAFVLEFRGSEKHATALAFHPKGKLVGVGYQDGTMAVWDLSEVEKDTNYMPERWRVHGSKISDIAFSKDGKLMVVGSLDKTATVWEIEAKDESKKAPYLNNKYDPIQLKNHTDWVTAVAFSNNGEQIITGMANGKLMIWEVNPAIYANQICSMLDQKIDRPHWMKYIGTDDPEEKKLYLEMPNNKRRTPDTTCGVVGDRANLKD